MAERAIAGANPQLADLAFLVGAWEMELSQAAFLPDPPATVRSPVSFEWVEAGAFLLLRMGENALWLIGRDEAQPSYTVLYYDARAVSRVYRMRVSDDTWTMERDSAQFAQRFTGHISADRRTITGEWTKRSGQGAWEHDFDVTYRRLDMARSVASAILGT